MDITTSRFRLIDKKMMPPPSKCWACGSDDRDCIDFGANAWEGAVLVCVLCISEAAAILPESHRPPVDNRAEEVLEEVNGLLSACVADINKRVGHYRAESLVKLPSAIAGGSKAG